MDQAFLDEALPALFRGLGNTIGFSLAGIALGFALGAVVAAAAMAANPWPRLFAAVYVSFFRGVPLLVQVLIAFYAVPFIGIDVPPAGAAIGALGCCCAAYAAEILRGGLSLVPHGAVEAARLLGLNARQTFLRIRLPIAIAAMRPALVSEAIMIVKASSLISLVGILELTRSAQAIAANTFQPLPAYALCGMFYLVLNIVLSVLGGLARRRA
ncbi:amino acid ABC transporter permease [Acetobacteraceae bacterium H6797]|nr:amino acid ABC transporter permease [Acetobacteraceae bacterium H6797]